MKLLKLTLIFVVVLGAIAGGFFLMTKTESDPLPEIDTEHLKYPCDKCDMKFISEDELKKHNDDAHKSVVKAPIQPELKFKCRCPDCDMKFSNMEAQYNHELRAHWDKIHKCPNKSCGYYNFTGKEDLDRHMKQCHLEE